MRDGTRVLKWIIYGNESYMDKAGRYYDLYSILMGIPSIKKYKRNELLPGESGHSFEVDTEVGVVISDYMNGRGYAGMELEEYLSKLFGGNE